MVLDSGEEILQKTPEMLPVLKSAGVVDAGGRGLLTIFTGFAKVLNNDEENLLKINAASLLLSYIRPQVRNITSLSKFSEQNIPFIDFTSQI